MATVFGAFSNVWFIIAVMYRLKNADNSQKNLTGAEFMLGAEYMRMMLEDMPMAIC